MRKARELWGAKLTDKCVWGERTWETSVNGIIVLQMCFRPNWILKCTLDWSSGGLPAVGLSFVPLRVTGKGLCHNLRYQYLLFPIVNEENHEQRHWDCLASWFSGIRSKTHIHSVMTPAVADQRRICLQAGQLSAFQRRLSISQWIVWSILRNFLSFHFHFLHFPLLLFFHVIIFPPLSPILRLFISASCETNSMQGGWLLPPPPSLTKVYLDSTV